jgi:ectoine hydroxylase-related dioxygenase (phytanoyl-CoA dioxygenase family)
MSLTSEQKKFWNENGYLAVENVIPADLIVAERERFDWLCRHWDAPDMLTVAVGHETGLPKEKWSAKTVRKLHNLVQLEPAFRAHAFHPNLVDIVADLVGTPLSLYENQALLKPPSLGSAKPAHQDNAYFKVKPADALITAWGAVDDATLENGCMRYFAGTHKLGPIKHNWVEGTPHQVPEGFQVDDAVPVPLKAGGVVFHHSLTLHLSLENTSPNWRRSFICHFCRDAADLSEASQVREKLLRIRN